MKVDVKEIKNYPFGKYRICIYESYEGGNYWWTLYEGEEHVDNTILPSTDLNELIVHVEETAQGYGAFDN